MRHLGAAGIWDDVRRTTGSNANGAWFKRPDGIIEQMGTATLTGGTIAVTFPIPFPNACLFVTPVADLTGVATNSTLDVWVSGRSKTAVTLNGRQITTVLSVLTASSGAFPVDWYAIGN